MNILDYLILAILACGLLSGMHKGMITSALSSIGLIGAWYGAQRFYTQLSNLALSNQTLMAVLNQYLEPDSFFDSQAQAMTSVTQLVAQGEGAIAAIVDKIGGKFEFLRNAYSANLRTLAFQKLGINTVSEYFDQTFWTALFSVGSFVVLFIAFYLVISLFVNLLDRVIAFPLLKRLDWLVGGLFGVARACIAVLLVLVLVPPLLTTVAPDLTQTLMDGSKLVSIMRNVDYLSVSTWISSLVMGQ